MSISVVGDGLLLSQKGDLVVADGTAEGRLAVGSDGQILTASSTDSLGVKWINAPVATQKWATIAYSQVTAATTSLVFSSINSTYTDLKLIVSARASASTSQAFRVYANSLTSGYSMYYDYNYDTTVGTTSSTGGYATLYFESAPGQFNLGENLLGVIDIIDYRSTTKAKSVLFKAGWARNSLTAGERGLIATGSGSINTLDAITSLTILCGAPATPQLGAGTWALLMGVIR